MNNAALFSVGFLGTILALGLLCALPGPSLVHQHDAACSGAGDLCVFLGQSPLFLLGILLSAMLVCSIVMRLPQAHISPLFRPPQVL